MALCVLVRTENILKTKQLRNDNRNSLPGFSSNTNPHRVVIVPFLNSSGVVCTGPRSSLQVHRCTSIQNSLITFEGAAVGWVPGGGGLGGYAAWCVGKVPIFQT